MYFVHFHWKLSDGKASIQTLPVGAEQTARDLKMRYPEAVLIGERHGVILPGFEYGNSPSQTEAAELEGKC